MESREQNQAVQDESAPQAERAALDVEPCAHSWQWCEPVAAAIDPAEQCTQAKVPGRDLA